MSQTQCTYYRTVIWYEAVWAIVLAVSGGICFAYTPFKHARGYAWAAMAVLVTTLVSLTYYVVKLRRSPPDE